METKTCTKCSETKPLSEFPIKRDNRRGTARHINQCRPCERERLRIARRRLRAAVTTMQERRRLRVGAKEARRRAWREHNRRVARALRAARAASRPPRRPPLTEEERRAYWRAHQRHRRRTQPMRTAARRAVQRAVESGRLLKPSACQRCEAVCDPRELHGHHHRGYSPQHRLDVVWLCTRCHVDEEGAWGAALHGARTHSAAAEPEIGSSGAWAAGDARVRYSPSHRV